MGHRGGGGGHGGGHRGGGGHHSSSHHGHHHYHGGGGYGGSYISPTACVNKNLLIACQIVRCVVLVLGIIMIAVYVSGARLDEMNYLDYPEITQTQKQFLQTKQFPHQITIPYKELGFQSRTFFPSSQTHNWYSCFDEGYNVRSRTVSGNFAYVYNGKGPVNVTLATASSSVNNCSQVTALKFSCYGNFTAAIASGETATVQYFETDKSERSLENGLNCIQIYSRSGWEDAPFVVGLQKSTYNDIPIAPQLTYSHNTASESSGLLVFAVFCFFAFFVTMFIALIGLAQSGCNCAQVCIPCCYKLPVVPVAIQPIMMPGQQVLQPSMQPIFQPVQQTPNQQMFMPPMQQTQIPMPVSNMSQQYNQIAFQPVM